MTPGSGGLFSYCWKTVSSPRLKWQLEIQLELNFSHNYAKVFTRRTLVFDFNHQVIDATSDGRANNAEYPVNICWDKFSVLLRGARENTFWTWTKSLLFYFKIPFSHHWEHRTLLYAQDTLWWAYSITYVNLSSFCWVGREKTHVRNIIEITDFLMLNVHFRTTESTKHFHTRRISFDDPILLHMWIWAHLSRKNVVRKVGVTQLTCANFVSPK